jgi:hypothetical protein
MKIANGIVWSNSGYVALAKKRVATIDQRCEDGRSTVFASCVTISKHPIRFPAVVQGLILE